jgi:hypothetical protein
MEQAVTLPMSLPLPTAVLQKCAEKQVTATCPERISFSDECVPRAGRDFAGNVVEQHWYSRDYAFQKGSVKPVTVYVCYMCPCADCVKAYKEEKKAGRSPSRINLASDVCLTRPEVALEFQACMEVAIEFMLAANAAIDSYYLELLGEEEAIPTAGKKSSSKRKDITIRKTVKKTKL